jgi:CheY-like chemotaxis protein
MKFWRGKKDEHCSAENYQFDSSAKTVEISSKSMKGQSNHKYKVLAVDDESSVRMAIQMLLKHDGHEVQLVDSGEAALAMLEQGKFDLIITDYSMQGMKGAQLAILVKQRWPNQPIIMITAFADEFKTYGKPPEGVDFIISKPFSQKELREAVAQVLS